MADEMKMRKKNVVAGLSVNVHTDFIQRFKDLCVLVFMDVKCLCVFSLGIKEK